MTLARPDTAPLAPITVADLWDLQADPGRIAAAAAGWRGFAARARISREAVDRRAGALHGDNWTGAAADTYHAHRRRFGDSVDDVADLGDQLGAALDNVAALLRRGQGLLADAYAGIAVASQRFRDSVTFRPHEPQDLDAVSAAITEATTIRDEIDQELARHIAAFRRAQSTLDEIGTRWNAIAEGRAVPWTAPAEATTGVSWLTDGNRIVLNTGTGNDTVDIRIDPTTGEQILTVNGTEHRFAADRYLTVRVGQGDDTVTVQPGTRVHLTMLGGTGDDTLSGGDGNDRLLGNTGRDTISGGAGDDWISLGASRQPHTGEIDVAEQADGGDGNDRVAGSLGNDRIIGGAGDDRLLGGEGEDTVDGGAGNDTVSGGGATDNVYGRDGTDRVFGGDGRDYVDGGAGDDHLDGGLGDDTLYGLSGDDVLHGGSGDDYLEGATGRDVVDGGTGKDVLSGGRDDDVIRGGSGDDTIYTGHGRDQVTGGSGQDTAFGQIDDVVDDTERVVNVEISEVGSYIKVEGSPEFVERVQADLDMLRASPRGQMMLGALQQAHEDSKHWLYDGNGLTITETRDENSYANSGEKPFWHDSPTIRFNPSLDTIQGGPPISILYHEMAHIYDDELDTQKDGAYNDAKDPDVMWEDGRKVGVPNLERQAVGLSIDHDGDPATPNMIDPDHPIEFTENGLRREMGVVRRATYGSS
jgi:Ca2+-binding RTX toxin-like protein